MSAMVYGATWRLLHNRRAEIWHFYGAAHELELWTRCRLLQLMAGIPVLREGLEQLSLSTKLVFLLDSDFLHVHILTKPSVRNAKF